MKPVALGHSVLTLLLLSLIASSAFAGRVKGYIRKDGTFIATPDRSAPDSGKRNNYSSEGRINPHPGKAGKTPAHPK